MRELLVGQDDVIPSVRSQRLIVQLLCFGLGGPGLVMFKADEQRARAKLGFLEIVTLLSGYAERGAGKGQDHRHISAVSRRISAEGIT